MASASGLEWPSLPYTPVSRLGSVNGGRCRVIIPRSLVEGEYTIVRVCILLRRDGTSEGGSIMVRRMSWELQTLSELT